MIALLDTDAPSNAVGPDADYEAPRLGEIARRTAVSVVVAVIAPAALFSATTVVVNVYAAVVVALAWMFGTMLWRWATQRPFSWLLLLSAAIMTVRAAFTLATGNTFVYFVQPVFADAAVATVFLISVLTARPMVARLAPDFYPMPESIANRPAVRLLFRRLTFMWGLVIVAKGSITLWLLETQSTVAFVLIKNSAVITLTLLAIGVTVALSVLMAHREGLLPARGHG